MGRAGSVPKLSLDCLLPEAQVQRLSQQSRCGTGKAATMVQQENNAPLGSDNNALPEAGKQMPGPACPGQLLGREIGDHNASSLASQRLGSDSSRAGRPLQLRHGGQQQDASSPAVQRLGPGSSQAGHPLQLSAGQEPPRRGQWTPRRVSQPGPAPESQIQLTPRRMPGHPASAAQSMGFAQLDGPPAAGIAPTADGCAASQLGSPGCATPQAGAASAATLRGGRTARMAGLSPVPDHLALQLPSVTPRSADRSGAGGALPSRTPAAALGTSSFARFHTQ